MVLSVVLKIGQQRWHQQGNFIEKTYLFNHLNLENDVDKPPSTELTTRKTISALFLCTAWFVYLSLWHTLCLFFDWFRTANVRAVVWILVNFFYEI